MKFFRETLIGFQHFQFLSALGKSLIKSVLNFESVLKRGCRSSDNFFFRPIAISILGDLGNTWVNLESSAHDEQIFCYYIN